MIPGLRRSPGEGNGYPLQYSGLENSMDYTVTKSRTLLSDFHFHSSLAIKFSIRNNSWTSLVVRWKKIHLPMQGMQVQSLVWEDSMFFRTTKPLCRKPLSPHSGACKPQLELPGLEPVLCNKRSHCHAHHNEERVAPIRRD